MSDGVLLVDGEGQSVFINPAGQRLLGKADVGVPIFRQAEVYRLRDEHGRAVLWEGHSIRGEVPFLFDGRLPDLNLGTAGGTSCSPALQARLESVLGAQARYDWVANGRFKGGYITRHYGDPANGIDAVQLETSQRIYMDEASYAWDEDRAAAAQETIRALLVAALGDATA